VDQSIAMSDATVPQSNDTSDTGFRAPVVDTFDKLSVGTHDEPVKKVRFLTEVHVAEQSDGQEHDVSHDQRYVVRLKSAGASILQGEGRE
jgi:hypothetical protein